MQIQEPVLQILPTEPLAGTLFFIKMYKESHTHNVQDETRCRDRLLEVVRDFKGSIGPYATRVEEALDAVKALMAESGPNCIRRLEGEVMREILTAISIGHDNVFCAITVQKTLQDQPPGKSDEVVFDVDGTFVRTVVELLEAFKMKHGKFDKREPRDVDSKKDKEKSSDAHKSTDKQAKAKNADNEESELTLNELLLKALTEHATQQGAANLNVNGQKDVKEVNALCSGCWRHSKGGCAVLIDENGQFYSLTESKKN